MEKQRKIKVLSLVALIVAVLGLTVAFAAMSETLTINGTANLDAADWDVHFENLEYEGELAETGTPIIDGTTITGIDAALTANPGSLAVYMVDIVNNGTIDAKIESVITSKLCTLSSEVERCDWNDDGVVTEEDITKINDNFTFMVAYANDAGVLREGDILKAGEKMQLLIGIVYSKCSMTDEGVNCIEPNSLPQRELIFEDLSVDMKYVQVD